VCTKSGRLIRLFLADFPAPNDACERRFTALI
jgi:hypothetical protein